MEAPHAHDSPVGASSSCSEAELSTDLLASSPTPIPDDDAAATIPIRPSSLPSPSPPLRQNTTTNICNKSYAATLHARRSNTSSSLPFASPSMMWHQQPSRGNGAAAAAGHSAVRGAAESNTKVSSMYRTYNKCYYARDPKAATAAAAAKAVPPQTAAAAAAATVHPVAKASPAESSSYGKSINLNNDSNDDNNQKQPEIKPRLSRKKRPLQFILDEKIRQSKERSDAHKSPRMQQLDSSDKNINKKDEAARNRDVGGEGGEGGNYHLAPSKINYGASTTAMHPSASTTRTSLPISEMIIVGGGHGDRGNAKSEEGVDYDDNMEVEEEFSPLTCPPSQPAWGVGRSNDDRDHDEEEDNEEGEEEKETEVVEGAHSNEYLKMGKPSPLDFGTSTDNNNNEDEEEETRMDDEEAKSIGRKDPLPHVKGGLVCDYEKAVLGEYDEEDDEVQEGRRAQNIFTPTWKTRNEDHALPGTKPPPPSSNAATVASERIRKGRGEATALALAAEYEESSKLDDEGGEDEGEADKKQRGAKRKQGPTALALAEYDETGEVDSYFDNSRAAEERKGRLLALATCMEEPELQDVHDNGKEYAGVQGELSSTTEENQSEPLFSQPIQIHETAMTAAQSSTATKSSINEMICAVRHEFDEMGKALLCPICQSTLKHAIILPCVHAFCKACLKDYYNPPSVKRAEKKKGKPASPPRKPKAECPVCKTANPGKRSGEAAPHLDELARAYKLMGRSFSFAPVKYTENVLMTQLLPDEDVVSGRLDEDEDTGSKEQHLQVAKAVHGAFIEQTEIIHQSQNSRPISFKEKMKVHRYQQMAKEQEAVVRADEQVLSRVARGVRGMKQMVNAVKTVFVGKTEASKNTSEMDHVMAELKVASMSRNEAVNDSAAEEIAAAAAVSSTIEQANIGSESIDNNLNFGRIESSEAIQDEESTIGEDDFFSSREDSHYSTAREDLPLSSCHILTVINDGNTVKKAHRLEALDAQLDSSLRGSNVCNVESSSEFLKETRESIGTVATARCSPLVLHDGNTVRKPRSEQKSYHGLSFLATHFDDDHNSERPDNISPLAAASAEVKDTDADVTEANSHAIENITVGSIVFVQARTWPGINRPGGVARVTMVHPSSDNGDSTKFDVAYVLGGKEKGVDESFVTFNESSPNKECPDGSMMTEGCKSHQKKSRHRRAIVKGESNANLPNAPSFPIYCDEELKHIPEEVLKWAGILPKAKGKAKVQRKQQQTGSAPIKQAMKNMKRVLSQSNTVPKLRPMKKRKIVTDAIDNAISSCKDDRPTTDKSLREVISALSNEEIVTRADSRYSALLSPFKKQSASDSPMTLHAVTSSLSDKDLELLDSFRQFLKGKSVVLKLMKDFNPNKTQICLTSASLSSNKSCEPIDVVSSSRTLKVMRSALIGVPILTPAWMEACLKEGHLVSPTGTMCIRSLPRKQSNATEETSCLESPTEQFGVAKYAAAFQEIELSYANHVLSGTSVLLCGRSAESGMMKDLTVLLKQAGANVLSSLSTASRLLTDMSEGKTGLGPIVFLCDDSPMDESSGISDALFKQVEKLLVGNSSASLHCVAFNWLFDSIGCAAPMKTSAYEPAAPRARALWKLDTTNRLDIAGK